MKSFNSTKDFNTWLGKITKKAGEKSKEEIAREVYKDSKKYTYIDTQTMFDTGNNSDFKSGYVIIKGPQVRWLYYTTWIKGHKNPQATPQWFEKTKSENMNKYKNVFVKTFNGEKG